jgi:hypothetical protein
VAEETPAERRKREREKMRQIAEDLAAKKKEKRDNAIQRRMDAEAAAQREDLNWEIEARKYLGDDIVDIEKGLREAPTDAEIAEALRVFDEARKKAKGGMFSSGDQQAAAKHIKKNQDKIKKAQKKANKGCTVVALLLLAVGGSAVAGAVWGAAEVISALM